MNRFDVRTFLDANAEPPQRREHMDARRFGPRLREARLADEIATFERARRARRKAQLTPA